VLTVPLLSPAQRPAVPGSGNSREARIAGREVVVVGAQAAMFEAVHDGFLFDEVA